MNYPRVLVVTIGRINAVDAANNSLLLRNLFGSWPRDYVAQIYSSGDNGDNGYFGQYFQLGPHERRFGGLFYSLKAMVKEKGFPPPFGSSSTGTQVKPKSVMAEFSRTGGGILLNTGIYEIIFQPRLSKKMMKWVEEFKPDIIFAQGYCLTFTWLPLMLADYFRLPIAYYPSDDWPSDIYRSNNMRIPVISRLVDGYVDRASHHLVAASSIRIAFNRYMKKEYMDRYGLEFSVLMHGDDFSRFNDAPPKRFASPDECWIVTTGVFNINRIPLLNDLEQACRILTDKSIKVKATVFTVSPHPDILRKLSGFRHVDFALCPTHDGLASILRGADILFLPERFDETAAGIRLSVSSKAHLFMFSGRPIVVYSSPVTGISRYAKEDGWAAVVDHQDPLQLAQVFERLMKDDVYRQQLIDKACKTAINNHDLASNQLSFSKMVHAL